MSEIGQTKFEGHAIIEIYGHSRAAGYVTTEYYGPAALFRIDVPELKEREYELKRPQSISTEGAYQYCPAGTKVKRPASPARSELLGPGAIFRMHPCTEEAALAAIEEIYPRPLILLSLPQNREITEGETEECGCRDEDCPSHVGPCPTLVAAGTTECSFCKEYHEAEDAGD